MAQTHSCAAYAKLTNLMDLETYSDTAEGGVDHGAPPDQRVRGHREGQQRARRKRTRIIRKRKRKRRTRRTTTAAPRIHLLRARLRRARKRRNDTEETTARVMQDTAKEDEAASTHTAVPLERLRQQRRQQPRTRQRPQTHWGEEAAHSQRLPCSPRSR